MPFHRIYHTPGQFTSQEKESLAEAITKIYTEKVGLPAFYVVVAFVPIEPDFFFVGGKRNNKFVRISIYHIAKGFDSHAQEQEYLDGYDRALAPFIKDKGYDWETSFWNQNCSE